MTTRESGVRHGCTERRTGTVQLLVGRLCILAARTTTALVSYSFCFFGVFKVLADFRSRVITPDRLLAIFIGTFVVTLLALTILIKRERIGVGVFLVVTHLP